MVFDVTFYASVHASNERKYKSHIEIRKGKMWTKFQFPNIKGGCVEAITSIEGLMHPWKKIIFHTRGGD